MNTIYTFKYNALWWIKYTLLNTTHIKYTLLITIHFAEYNIDCWTPHLLLIKTHLTSNTTQFYAKYVSLNVLSTEIIKYFGQVQNFQSYLPLKTFVAWGRLNRWWCGDKKGTFGLFISDTWFCTERKTYLQKISPTHWVTIPTNSLPVI